MKIAVVAANGRSGVAFVEKALTAGHNVRAGVYGASSFIAHEHLTVMQCDASKPTDIERLIGGQEAVVSLIGHVKGSPPNIQTEATANIIESMKRKDIKRLVSLTGTGVRFPGDKITVLDRMLNLSIRIIDPNRVNDGINHVRLLQDSGLDWTVIRVLKLQNTTQQAYSLKENGPTKPYVSRSEVADAILDVLENNSFIQQAPIIS